MTSINLLPSRLRALVKYGQWSQDDVVELITALVKQYSRKMEKTNFNTWMAKILYQVEIHKLNKIDLTLNKNEPSPFVDDIEVTINDIVKKTTEKSLEEILEEIQAQANIDENILLQVKDIVSVYSSSLCPVLTHLQDLQKNLIKLCKAVEDTKGWKPRLTQMMSWCILVLSGSSQLVQVGTGEGKSCIVAMFAAYRTMIGESVDIISSSPVLAERDAEEWHSFYKKLGITVDVNTNKSKVQEMRSCYECQVVYGTTESFAGDWLRHRFQRENVRPGREFQCVIVDEVDSLMLDKGLEVVYLNSQMAVMEPLNVILAEIWFVVNQLEDLDVEKTLDRIRFFHHILPERLGSDTDTNYILQMAENSNTSENSDTSADTSLVGEPERKESSIPSFQEHINRRLKTWIENAFLAKTMTLGHEYILHEDDVVPVDYRSTGVVQNNMKWGDGLQQFLEMKHQTRLSNMCIITNFKSNVNLFRSYKRIYGLTGTLGNQTELDMLQRLYPGIRTCKIPPFKRRKLYEEEGIVINDENEWVQTICTVVNKNVKPTVYRGSRAALVICETIKQAQIVHNALSTTLSTDKLKLYTNNNVDNSKVTGEVVTEGSVIVATNLAGRGTDLKVSPEVNDSGGLFVVQTFLPLNVRVEQQAFGRTAREGNPGSAQLIMCSTHFSESLKLVMALNSPLARLLTLLTQLTSTMRISGLNKNKFEEALKTCQENPNEKNFTAMVRALRDLLNFEEPTGITNLEVAKEARDIMVQIRLSGFLENDIPKITKKEDLFSDYLDMLDTIYHQNQYGDIREDIVSLHECWGMWLLMKFNENVSIKTLRQQLKEDLQSAKKKLDNKQSPSSMIYHYIRTGNKLRSKGSLAESIEMYTRAIENDPCWMAIALYNRALSILSKGDSGYIVQALADLAKAEEAVSSYMKKLALTSSYVEISSKAPSIRADTLLTKQFQGKHLAHYLLRLNIQQAMKVLQIAESKGEDVQVRKDHVVLLLLNPVLFRAGGIKEVGREIANLYSLGLDTIFSLETVYSFFKRLRKIFG